MCYAGWCVCVVEALAQAWALSASFPAHSAMYPRNLNLCVLNTNALFAVVQ